MSDETTPAEPPADQAPQPAEPATEPTTETDEPLGESGKRALDSERQRRREAIAERDELRSRVAELEQAQMNDAEKAIATARAEGEQAASATYRDQVSRYAARGAAAGKFQSPDLAAKLIGTVPFNDDGTVNEAELADRVDTLLAENPELAINASTPSPSGIPSGPRQTGGGWAQSDLRGKSSSEIAEAFRRGELTHLTSSN